eukprot:5962454-Alexandrium_andersonii.AAC.1
MKLKIDNYITANKPWTQPWAEQLANAQMMLNTHSSELQKAIIEGNDCPDTAKAQADLESITALHDRVACLLYTSPSPRD